MAAVIADASCLIALHQIGRLSLLERLFVEIQIPPAVSRETTPTLPELPPWIIVRELTYPIRKEILGASLGAGETEALSLACDTKADVVIIDDGPARRLAFRLGLPVIGTAGVLLKGKQAGVIAAVRPLLHELLRFDFHLSVLIVEAVLRDAGEQD